MQGRQRVQKAARQLSLWHGSTCCVPGWAAAAEALRGDDSCPAMPDAVERLVNHEVRRAAAAAAARAGCRMVVRAIALPMQAQCLHCTQAWARSAAQAWILLLSVHLCQSSAYGSSASVLQQIEACKEQDDFHRGWLRNSRTSTGAPYQCSHAHGNLRHLPWQLPPAHAPATASAAVAARTWARVQELGSAPRACE